MKRTIASVVAILLLLGILAAGAAAGCGSGGVSADAVANVGGTSIKKAQFQELMTQVKAQVTSQGQTFPAVGSATYKSYEAMIMDYLVQAAVVRQSASLVGASVTDKQVASQVAALEKQYGGEQKLTTLLKGEGATLALLKQSLKDQMLAQAVSTTVVAKATVSDAQIKAYWQANAATLRKSKKTATLAKARATIRTTLLSQAKSTLWQAWLSKRTTALGVTYAADYDPAALTSSPTPSASASAAG